ncbi:hypothetical protein NTGM5_720009 [Candidatus Nitrotoga sp. M5]|nr:hypothetical protein NTGM5_720009 [Candidatus Nitrotoga sp. M5]
MQRRCRHYPKPRKNLYTAKAAHSRLSLLAMLLATKHGEAVWQHEFLYNIRTAEISVNWLVYARC